MLNFRYRPGQLADILSLVLLALLWIQAMPTHAGRPMVTDDAGIVEAGSCQLETWIDRYRKHSEFWAVPACNPSGNLELSLGGALSHQSAHTETAALLIQAKTLLKPMQPNGWGIGLAAGVEHLPNESGGVRDWYVYSPVSKSFRDDQLLLHTNLGWLHDGADQQDKLTWGLGAELQLAEGLHLMLEAFGEGQDRPLYQLGFAYWPIADRLQLDAAFGQAVGLGGDTRWFSVGLTLLLFAD